MKKLGAVIVLLVFFFLGLQIRAAATDAKKDPANASFQSFGNYFYFIHETNRRLYEQNILSGRLSDVARSSDGSVAPRVKSFVIVKGALVILTERGRLVLAEKMRRGDWRQIGYDGFRTVVRVGDHAFALHESGRLYWVRTADFAKSGWRLSGRILGFLTEIKVGALVNEISSQPIFASRDRALRVDFEDGRQSLLIDFFSPIEFCRVELRPKGWP